MPRLLNLAIILCAPTGPVGVHAVTSGMPLPVSTPGTPTLMCTVGRISVLQNEKYSLFADFCSENLPYFGQNAGILGPKYSPFLGEKTDFLKVSFST